MARSESAERSSQRTVRRWKVMMRLCQAALAALVVFGVWSIGFARGSGPTPVLPATDAQFSIDLSVVGAVDHPVIYAVEQRARPAYRIFAFDPATGEDTTVFTVPDDAIVYGIALSNDRSTLAVTYSPDFHLDGSGLWTLDLESGEMTMVVDVESEIYHADPVWTIDDSVVLTTRVDRRGDAEQLSVGRTTLADASTEVLVSGAINPAVVGDDIYALRVDESQARRGIGRVDGTGLADLVTADLDLDHLVAGDNGDLFVAALDTTESSSGLTFGSVAEAHGNHDRPSTWWTVPLDVVADTEPAVSTVAPLIVYDAAFGDGQIVYATGEGLSFADPTSGIRIDVIKSRAIRLVAA